MIGRPSQLLDEEGISGLMEVAAVILAVAILTTAGLFTYRLATGSGADQQAQSNLRAAASAANDFYSDTQDFTASPPNNMSLAQVLASYDHGACFVAGSYQSSCGSGGQTSNIIAYVTGPLSALSSSDSNPGGYMALATYSSSGTCFEILMPADASSTDWQWSVSSPTSCQATANPPSGASKNSW